MPLGIRSIAVQPDGQEQRGQHDQPEVGPGRREHVSHTAPGGFPFRGDRERSYAHGLASAGFAAGAVSSPPSSRCSMILVSSGRL